MRYYQIMLIFIIMAATSMIILIINHIKKKKDFKDSYHEKINCYKRILSFMSVVLSNNNIADKYNSYASNLDFNDFYLDILQRHYILFRDYVSKDVLEAIEDFVDNASEDNYKHVENQMNNDIYSMNLRI